MYKINKYMHNFCIPISSMPTLYVRTFLVEKGSQKYGSFGPVPQTAQSI
jgi:hypothetical protein